MITRELHWEKELVLEHFGDVVCNFHQIVATKSANRNSRTDYSFRYPHHVTQRGNRRADVLEDDVDREAYLRCLYKLRRIPTAESDLGPVYRLLPQLSLPVPEHAVGPFSHQNKLDYDVRYIRKDRQQLPVTVSDSQYDQDASEALVDHFKAHGAVTVFAGLNSKRTGVTPYEGHDDHLHFRFSDPDGDPPSNCSICKEVETCAQR